MPDIDIKKLNLMVSKLKQAPREARRWLIKIAAQEQVKGPANNHDIIMLKRMDLVEFAGPVFKAQRFYRATPMGAAAAQRIGTYI